MGAIVAINRVFSFWDRVFQEGIVVSFSGAGGGGGRGHCKLQRTHVLR